MEDAERRWSIAEKTDSMATLDKDIGLLLDQKKKPTTGSIYPSSELCLTDMVFPQVLCNVQCTYGRYATTV